MWAIALTLALYCLLCFLGVLTAYCFYIKSDRVHDQISKDEDIKITIPSNIREENHKSSPIHIEINVVKGEAANNNFNNSQLFDCNAPVGFGNDLTQSKYQPDRTCNYLTAEKFQMD